MRLAIWTAKNDFREACKSEPLPQTSACKAALDQPPQPPTIKKRGIAIVSGHNLGLGSTVLATCCILLVSLYIVVKKLMRFGRKHLEQIKTPIGLSIPAHHLSERDALIRLLFDTAQRLEAEGDEWELPAELKVELITMIEQSGPQTTTEPPASGLSQQIETRESSPSRGASGKGAEAATTVIKKSEVTTAAQNTAVNVLETIKNRSQLVPVLPPLPPSSESEATPTFDSSTASALLPRSDDGQTTHNNSKIECNMFLPALSNLLQVIRSTADDFPGVKGATFLLCRFGIPIALSFVLFVCSDVYTEGKLYHWSGISQSYRSIWRAVCILVSLVTISEVFQRNFIKRLQQGIVNISSAIFAMVVGLIVITFNALRVRCRQEVSTPNDLSITFLTCALSFEGMFFSFWVLCLVKQVKQIRLAQLWLALLVFCAVLMVFMIELD
jgi:hypothetical protein